MFARDKRIGPYTYVYLVENIREGGRAKQRIIANLGRKEVVVAHGDLDRLARSVARLAQRSMVLSLVEGEAPPDAVCRRIGPALLFERLWHEVGCRAVLEGLAAGNPSGRPHGRMGRPAVPRMRPERALQENRARSRATVGRRRGGAGAAAKPPVRPHSASLSRSKVCTSWPSTGTLGPLK